MKGLVVGGGIIGLSVATEVRKRLDCEVVLYSPQHPLETTSAGAGGLWMPFHCEPMELVNVWSEETLAYLLQLHELGDSVVEILPAFQFGGTDMENAPKWANHLNGALNFKVTATSDPSVKEAITSEYILENYSKVWKFDTPVINSPKYLERLYNRLKDDSQTEVCLNGKPFEDLDEVEAFARSKGCSFVVNCTGLGSKRLLKDDEVVPARGALLHFERPSDCNQVLMCEGPPIGEETRPAYIIPRGNIMVVGGTYLLGDTNMEITRDEIKKIGNDARTLLPSLNIDYSNTWVGLRPSREAGIRTDIVRRQNVKGEDLPIFNNFGHGGSGWTTFVGASKATVDSITEYFNLSTEWRSKM
mmetsp:Transcript_2556/g.2888  ORF Transcript_2556/g.2888 Transcript_2556/m.2888 type:complete len:359 (+) Transcript_2556:242-1318(+)